MVRWSPTGATPNVLYRSPATGVYVMSRVLPGSTAPQEGTASEASRYCELLERMQRPDLPPTTGRVGSMTAIASMRLDWARDRFVDAGYEEYRELRELALRMLPTLAASGQPSNIVHGDLQGKNVLVGPSGRYIAIDPFLAKGDINAEAALWAVIQENPSTIDETIQWLSKSQLLDAERLWAWAFLFGVAEYRLYVPRQAARTHAFVTQTRRRYEQAL